MLPILAQSTPDAAALLSWLQVVFYLAGLVAAIAVAWNYLSGRSQERTVSPQPLVVKEHQAFATKAELAELRADFNSLRDGIQRSFTELDAKRSKSIAGLHESIEHASSVLRTELKDDTTALHNRVNDVLEAVSELRGRLQ